MTLRVRDALDARCVRAMAHERPTMPHLWAGLVAVFRSTEEGGAFAGLVTRWELARYPLRIFADMIPRGAPPTVSPDDSLEEAASRLEQSGLEAIAAVDEAGLLAGAVTRESLLAALLREERALQRTVRDSDAKLRAVLDAIPDAVVVWDALGVCIDVFAATGTVFGVPLEAARGAGLDASLPADQAAELRASITACLSAEEVRTTHVHRTVDERTFEYEVRLAPLDGRAIGVVRDVTERNELRAQLIFADRMRSMGMVAATVGHEVNNPLMYIQTNVQLLRGRIGEDDVARDMLDSIAEGASRIGAVVQGLRRFARPDAGAPGVVDVEDSLRAALNIAALHILPRARIVTRFAHRSLVRSTDAQLGQVFLNLLVNAAQAIPDGDSAAHEVRVLTEDVGDVVRVSIEDTGRGLDESVRERLFEAFVTTKEREQGTGLGLYISHKIVSSLGGRIVADHTTEGGAAFHVELPAAPAEERPAPVSSTGPANVPPTTVPPTTVPPTAVPPATVPPATVPPRSLRVLLVHEDPRVRLALAFLLASHDVTAVADAQAALAVLEATVAPDVVVLDLDTVTSSGADLYRRLSDRNPSVSERVLFLTSGSLGEKTKLLPAELAGRVVKKPLNAASLLRKLEEVRGS